MSIFMFFFFTQYNSEHKLSFTVTGSKLHIFIIFKTIQIGQFLHDGCHLNVELHFFVCLQEGTEQYSDKKTKLIFPHFSQFD